MSGYEILFNKIINGEDISSYVPQSRFEQIIKDMALGNEISLKPINRGEALLQAVNLGNGSGGSSGSDAIVEGNTLILGSANVSNSTLEL